MIKVWDRSRFNGNRESTKEIELKGNEKTVTICRDYSTDDTWYLLVGIRLIDLQTDDLYEAFIKAKTCLISLYIDEINRLNKAIGELQLFYPEEDKAVKKITEKIKKYEKDA